MSETTWPTFERPPSVAFVDVDGTLLAETTTFLFARILYRRGLIRRSFLLRALYHGLQHRLGRLDYGRLIAYGLENIARIPVVELERIAYENFVEHVRPRLFHGVVEHFNALRRLGTPTRPGLVVAGSGDRALESLPGLHGHADHTGRDRAQPVGRDRLGTTVLRRGQALLGRAMGRGAPTYPWTRRSPMRITGATGPCWNVSAVRSSSIPKGRLLRLARRRGWDVVRPGRPARPTASAPGPVQTKFVSPLSSRHCEIRRDLSSTPVDFWR